MNSKQRVLKALAREKADRAPFNIWMDRRRMDQFAQQYNDENFRINKWGADVLETFAALPFPTGEATEKTGTVWHNKAFLESWDDLDKVTMPDPTDDSVYALIKRDVAAFPDHAVVLDVPTAWSVAYGIRTFEDIFTDMVDYSDELTTLLERITEVQLEMVRRAMGMGVTALYLMEDLTSAQGPLMSPRFIHKYCLDYARPLAEEAHRQGIPVMFHCCGRVMDVLDEILKIGIDAINPVQPHLNDLTEFHAKYGPQVCLYGGLDNTYAIPSGNPESIRAHVLDVFSKVGGDGGLIFSTHDIPIDTPEENFHAVYQTIVNECRY